MSRSVFIAEDFRSLINRLQLLEAGEGGINPDRKKAGLETNPEDIMPSDMADDVEDDTDPQPSDLMPADRTYEEPGEDETDVMPSDMDAGDDTDPQPSDLMTDMNDEVETAPEQPTEPEERPKSKISELPPDVEVDKLMTKPRKPGKELKKIDVSDSADRLGLKNGKIFNSAFNNLRNGRMPTDVLELRELAAALDSLLVSDPETTTTVLNKLRKVFKSK